MTAQSVPKEVGGAVNRDRGARQRLADEYVGLLRHILQSANQGAPRSDFVRDVLSTLADFSGVDEAGLRVNEGLLNYRATLKRGKDAAFDFRTGARATTLSGAIEATVADDHPGLTRLGRAVMHGPNGSGQAGFTRNGSFWTGDTARPSGPDGLTVDGEYRSLAIIRFAVDDESHGLLLLWSRQLQFFTDPDVEFYEGITQTVGVAVADRRAQVNLRERVKELTCLYGINEVMERRDLTLQENLTRIVRLLPPAWLYPDIACARIAVDDIVCAAPGFGPGADHLTADIVVRDQRRGFVEVVYTASRPQLDEGPFLREERHLIDAVANQVAVMIERRHAEEEREQLGAQLRHADRLATIGQLAAGVAHELNEPLANVLGFAQLAGKTPDLPGTAADDLDKIVKAALHAREVISKLMLFARQKKPTRGHVKLNELVEEGLYFLVSRSDKAGVKIVRRLDPDLPEIAADAGQLHQVLVNLVVNAIQATPAGGIITIATEHTGPAVTLTVADTGVGMTAEIREQVFLPFFTTKPPGEGTGLGLPVVESIVAAHSGRIEVRSEPGKGSSFRVTLPIAGSAEPEKGDNRE